MEKNKVWCIECETERDRFTSVMTYEGYVCESCYEPNPYKRDKRIHTSIFGEVKDE